VLSLFSAMAAMALAETWLLLQAINRLESVTGSALS